MPMMLERWNDDKMDTLDAKVSGTAERVAVLEVKVDALDTKVDALDKKVDKGFERVDKRLEKVDEEFTAVRGELKAGFDRMQWWLIGAASAVIVAFIGGPHL